MVVEQAARPPSIFTGRLVEDEGNEGGGGNGGLPAASARSPHDADRTRRCQSVQSEGLTRRLAHQEQWWSLSSPRGRPCPLSSIFPLSGQSGENGET